MSNIDKYKKEISKLQSLISHLERSRTKNNEDYVDNLISQYEQQISNLEDLINNS